MTPSRSLFGRFAVSHATTIQFITFILCAAGIYSAFTIPSSVFPQTDFPRVVVLVDNGVMPAAEMMARITRPIEEALKDIPGALTVRSATGRGSAEINVFFNWRVDMVQSELYVLGRLSQIRGALPASATTAVWRLTFSSFPIIGVSLTSPTREITDLWEIARYTIKPRLLRIPGVARINLVGGARPEFHVIVDPLRLHAAGMSLQDVRDALERNNLVMPTGLHEESHKLFLAVVDGRVYTPQQIGAIPIAMVDGHPIRIDEIGRVQRGPEPVFNLVTAEGRQAVLLNLYSQPDGSTLDIATALSDEVGRLRRDLPPDMKIAYFYDQSLLVRASARSVWEAIGFGLMLSALILYVFLKSWRTTLTALLVIPVTVLVTLVALRAANLTFNLMTLGGIAAAIGLVIDDAIVVVEAIHTELLRGAIRLDAVKDGIAEILRPLIGSTLTPVVVFLPLAYLSGIAGVFFRALALTMVVGLLTSLLLAVTFTPAVAARLIRRGSDLDRASNRLDEEGRGPVLQVMVRLYEYALRWALRRPAATLALCAVLMAAGAGMYCLLESDFLPELDEGGFVIDYYTPWGTSLAETNRQLLIAERILRDTPEIESYSRRTGARLALAVAEPNTGDFLVKLHPGRARTTQAVIANLRHRLNAEVPGAEWDFPGILSDLIGDLTWSPKPIEVKVFSTDAQFLQRKAPEIAAALEQVPGVVDVFNGLVYTGPNLAAKVRYADAERFGLAADDIGAAVSTAMLGNTASSVLEGDRVLDVRVLLDPAQTDRIARLRELPIRSPSGDLVKLLQVADIVEEPGQLEMRREDLRQDVAITARLEGRDLGSAMNEIRTALSNDPSLPAGTIEFGGLYQQQQESFRNLLMVLAMAILLVFVVLMLEFGSLRAPVAIVFGALLAMFGAILALWATATTLNIVSEDVSRYRGERGGRPGEPAKLRQLIGLPFDFGTSRHQLFHLVGEDQVTGCDVLDVDQGIPGLERHQVHIEVLVSHQMALGQPVVDGTGLRGGVQIEGEDRDPDLPQRGRVAPLERRLDIGNVLELGKLPRFAHHEKAVGGESNTHVVVTVDRVQIQTHEGDLAVEVLHGPDPGDPKSVTRGVLLHDMAVVLPEHDATVGALPLEDPLHVVCLGHLPTGSGIELWRFRCVEREVGVDLSRDDGVAVRPLVVVTGRLFDEGNPVDLEYRHQSLGRDGHRRPKLGIQRHVLLFRSKQGDLRQQRFAELGRSIGIHDIQILQRGLDRVLAGSLVLVEKPHRKGIRTVEVDLAFVLRVRVVGTHEIEQRDRLLPHSEPVGETLPEHLIPVDVRPENIVVDELAVGKTRLHDKGGETHLLDEKLEDPDLELGELMGGVDDLSDPDDPGFADDVLQRHQVVKSRAGLGRRDRYGLFCGPLDKGLFVPRFSHVVRKANH
jgi:CzcA family heavy metal efflux pump